MPQFVGYNVINQYAQACTDCKLLIVIPAAGTAILYVYRARAGYKYYEINMIRFMCYFYDVYHFCVGFINRKRVEFAFVHDDIHKYRTQRFERIIYLCRRR